MRVYSGIPVVVMAWASIGVAQAQSPPAPDWSGFYLGGGVGAAVGNSQTATAGRGGNSYFTGTDFGQIADSGDGSIWQGRASGGIEAGYGRQFSHILVGIEASANTLSLNQSRSPGQFYQTAPGSRYVIGQRVEADWQATLRPRLGWAQDNWLAYVSGGLAVTRATLEVAFSDNFNNGASGYSKDTETKAGWTLGFGGEYALDRNWSLRGDYLYADYGKVTTSSVVTNTSNPGTSNPLDSSVDLRTHTVLLGLTYRFDGF